MSASVYDKLLKIVSRDAKAVLQELGRAGAGGLIRAVGTSLAGIAEDVVAGRRR